MIGYNRIGSSTSRLRARTSIAANSVPTAAKPSVPDDQQRRQQHRLREERRLNSSPTSGTSTTSTSAEQQQDAEQLADVDRRPSAGASSSARSVSLWRSRSNVRPSASVPENAIATHRIAGGDVVERRGLRRPARTRTSAPRHGEEQRRRQDLEAADLDGQVLAHDHATRRAKKPLMRWPSPAGSDRAAPPLPVSVPTMPAVAQEHARASAGRRRHRDRAWPARSGTRRAGARCSRATSAAGRRLIEAGERLVEQDQPRIVQQRALERDALAHAAREADDVVVGAIGEAGALERARRHAPARRDSPYSCAKNVRFSRAVSSGYRNRSWPSMPICARMPAPPSPPVRSPYSIVPVDGLQQRGENIQQRGLAGAVRTEQADDFAGLAGEGDLRQRLPPAVMPRDIDDGEAMNVIRPRSLVAARARSRSSSAITRSSSAVTRCSRASSASDSGFCGASARARPLSLSSFSRRACSFASCAACAFAGENANQAPIAEDHDRRDQRRVARRRGCARASR